MSGELLTAVKKLGDVVEQQGKELAELKKKSSANPSPTRVFGIRKGENPLTSRPYSFLKAIGLFNRCVPAAQCKVETDISMKLRKSMEQDGFKPEYEHSLFLPLWADALSDQHMELRKEIKSAMKLGDVDEDEITHLRKNYFQKDLSWLTETSGGALVPLAAQGDLIEVLRNKEVCVQAGASMFPLPPQGSLKLPKQTSAMTAAWIGENTTISKSDVGTSSVNLLAKKLGVRGALPNELMRYSNPAAEAMVRMDMSRVLALALDLAALEGSGGLQPTGLIKGVGADAILTYTASTVGATGNTFKPEDWEKMIGVVEDNNGLVDENTAGFICRPKLFRKSNATRADAVTANDAAGPFVEILKNLSTAANNMRCGYPVHKSNQVSGARVKSSGTDLTYIIFGVWSQLLIAMGAAMELDMNPYGDTAWSTDQTELRGILQADIAWRYNKAFVWCDQLIFNS